ncbi:hypothetical protein CHELA17_20407 [Chelatococcus asaccharovorans]|nr:hypothetical protein CHELA17_20407 [Chelatococcus asaccharovorans]
MMGIEELRRDRWLVDENAQPAEWIDALERCDRTRRHALPRDAVIAVAAADEITSEAVAFAARLIADPRMRGVEIVQDDALGAIDRGRLPRRHQVPCDLSLPVYHHLASDEPRKVEAMTITVKAEFDAVMNEPLDMEALPDLGAVHEIDGALFQNAGPDAAEHVAFAPALQDDGIDAGKLQQSTPRPAGPAPTMATCVRISSSLVKPDTARKGPRRQWTERAKCWTIRP